MSRSRLVSILFVIVLAVAGVIGAGFVPRIARKKELVASASEAAKPPAVRVARVELAPSLSELELPCDLQAMIESPINARVEGYIGRRLVDIGSRVNKGDLLAELETPEVDQQIRQARATIAQHQASLKQEQAKFAQSKASLKLAKITAERWQQLAKQGVVSRQDADDKDSQYEVRVAEVDAADAGISAESEAMSAAEANLQRLDEMKSFGQLHAPFAGIITFRNPDIGTLISPGAGGRELFRLSDISTIRVFVGIPQSHVPYIGPGVPAVLTVDDIPGRAFPGTVSNIANALDPNTRTMLAVIKIPNPDGVLKPGMYSRVRFKLPPALNALRVPGDAVVARNDGPALAVVDGQNKVHFRKIEIARDNGNDVEVKRGVAQGDIVVISPSDEIRENTVVEPKVVEKKPK